MLRLSLSNQKRQQSSKRPRKAVGFHLHGILLVLFFFFEHIGKFFWGVQDCLCNIGL